MARNGSDGSRATDILPSHIRDAVWPSVALKQMVAGGVQVTQEDLNKGFQSNYGPRVQVLAMAPDDVAPGPAAVRIDPTALVVVDR